MRDAETHNPSRIKLVSLVVPVTCHPDAFNAGYTGIHSLQERQTNLKNYSTWLGRMRQIFDYIAPPSSFSRTHSLVSPLLVHHVPASHAVVHTTVTGCDFLRDQGIAYAFKLRDAGVQSSLEVLPGVPHGFVWAVTSNATKQWTANQVSTSPTPHAKRDISPTCSRSDRIRRLDALVEPVMGAGYARRDPIHLVLALVACVVVGIARILRHLRLIQIRDRDSDTPNSSPSDLTTYLNMNLPPAFQFDVQDSRTGGRENEPNWLCHGDLGGLCHNSPFRDRECNKDDLEKDFSTMAESPFTQTFRLEGDCTASAFERDIFSVQDIDSTGPASPWQAPASTAPNISSSQGRMEEINKFFDELYPVYPIINKSSLYRRIMSTDTESDIHFQMLLLAIPMINLGRSCRRKPSEDCKSALQAQITALEQSRAEYDFAESPNLDTVVVSFLLFCVNNVLSRHNRAFLYLSETRDLFRFVTMKMLGQRPTGDDLRRSARIELTLFIAEAATSSIYGAGSFYKHRTTSVAASARILQENAADDVWERHIDNLLLRLAIVHAGATGSATQESQADSLQWLHLDGMPSFDPSYIAINQAVSHTLSPGSLTAMQKQTTDVILTTHWRSIETLAASVRSRQGLDSQRRLIRMLCEKSGSALASSCALDEGFLRVVGIGKVALIAFNLRNVVASACGQSGLDQCKNVLAGLVFTVIRADYEGSFLVMLRDCIDFVSGANDIRPPPSSIHPQAQDWIFGNHSA
ncbi:hypothetical protein CLAIMM_03669 [Cladophialophora immunda]|nr:hypothetical protein CLAIMM_03669 [Cladophialophora immunda]